MPITFVCDIEIELPRERVVELLERRQIRHEWQNELVSLTPLSGGEREVGARTALVYRLGGREFETIETITERKPPARLCATYEGQGMWNAVESSFTPTASGGTLWRVASEVRCSGMMWLRALVFPGFFRRQTTQAMRDFKDFAENL